MFYTAVKRSNLIPLSNEYTSRGTPGQAISRKTGSEKIFTWRGWGALISVGVKNLKKTLQEIGLPAFKVHKPASIPGGGEL
jgi:hypothetical protein